MISGVIASSPLLLQTFPASKLLRWVGEKAAFVLPWMPFPAEVHAEVGTFFLNFFDLGFVVVYSSRFFPLS